MSSQTLGHQRCPSMGSVRAFVPPEEHFGIVTTASHTPVVRHATAIAPPKQPASTDNASVSFSVRADRTSLKDTPTSSRRSSLSSFVEIDRDEMAGTGRESPKVAGTTKQTLQVVGNSKFYTKASPSPPRQPAVLEQANAELQEDEGGDDTSTKESGREKKEREAEEVAGDKTRHVEKERGADGMACDEARHVENDDRPEADRLESNVSAHKFYAEE